jgi:hypothetical protein
MIYEKPEPADVLSQGDILEGCPILVWDDGAAGGGMKRSSTLDRLVEPVVRTFTPEVARALVGLRADPELQARMDELAQKYNEGQMTPFAWGLGATLVSRRRGADAPRPQVRAPGR